MTNRRLALVAAPHGDAELCQLRTRLMQPAMSFGRLVWARDRAPRLPAACWLLLMERLASPCARAVSPACLQQPDALLGRLPGPPNHRVS